MTQPPSNQPPGFGAPNPDSDVPPVPPAPPQAPAAPPTAPATPVAPATPPQSPAAPPGAQQQPPAASGPTPPAGQPGQPAQPGGPYGYPQQPGPYGQPAQPGPYGQQPGPYGSPQQPSPYNQPAQPAQPGGPYGYPQQPGPYAQQPGPYGQQQNPYGGAGYPTAQAPMQGMPLTGPADGGAGGGGGKNPFKGKPGVIVAAAAAALLVIGGGTWLALGSGDDGKPVANPTESPVGPKPTASVDKGDGKGDGDDGSADNLNAQRESGEAKVEWLLKNNVDVPRNGSTVFGPWIVGDTVVKAMYKGIDGYSLADGSAKWHVDVPFELCAAPPEPSADGLMAFGVKDGAGDRAKCLQMQQVDLKTGKAGWKKSIPKPTGLFAFSDNTLAISANTVTASGTSSAYGFSLTDGKQLFASPTSGCKPYAYAGGSKLIAASKCPSGDVKKESHAISEIDPTTGAAKWTYKLPLTWEIDRVYSVDPLVVSTVQRDEDSTQKKWSIFSLTSGGKLRSQMKAGGSDRFSPRCGGSIIIFGKNLQGCTGVAADANTFYMATEADIGKSNEVVAFDLNSGAIKWRSKAPAEQSMKPLRMEGSEVLVYVEPRYGKGSALETIAPTGGAPKVLLKGQVGLTSIESSFYNTAYAYANGTFVIASGRISGSNDKAELETKSMMAYGK
ncbi:hypothetical protein AB0C52_07640 [Streptomyces sp. NPDC048717]|uniref:hypothetical protein n=1 Tax=Streptomyces sp. NPDC048717 TaxID=3154928 RepID=UPI00342A41DB